MIDFNALFKITYGLYIVCSGDKSKGNGFISNTVFQVSSEPAKFAASCNKDNLTCEMIEKSGNFSVSVLHKDTNAELIGRFGFRSGKDFDKMESLNVTFGETGVPIVRDASIACLEFKVVDQLDVGTHILFIGELVSAELIEKDLEPMTYAFYREVKKGLAPRNAPTYIDKEKLQEKTAVKEKSIYKCAACGHIYDSNEEEIAFEDLPGDWTCPVCGVEKEDFIKV